MDCVRFFQLGGASVTLLTVSLTLLYLWRSANLRALMLPYNQAKGVLAAVQECSSWCQVMAAPLPCLKALHC